MSSQGTGMLQEIDTTHNNEVSQDLNMIYGIPVWILDYYKGKLKYLRGYLRDTNLGKNVMVEFMPDSSKNIIKIKSYPKKNIGLIETNPIKSPDLVFLDITTSHGISHILGDRCAAGFYYTFSGKVLIFILPKGVSTSRLMQTYDNVQVQKFWMEMSTRYEPHIFSVTRQSLISFNEKYMDQALIAMGTEGAGKCLNIHMIVRFLAKNLSLYKHLRSSITISEKVAAITHLIRSLIQFPGELIVNQDRLSQFGTSAAGQIWRIYIDKESCFCGINVFLWGLNTNSLTYWGRHTSQPLFNIFYQVAHGIILEKDNPLIKGLEITDSERDLYLIQVSPHLRSNISDHLKNFRMTIGSLHSLGLSDEQKIEFFKILVSVVVSDAYVSLLINTADDEMSSIKIVVIPMLSRLLGVSIEQLSKAATTVYSFIQLSVGLYCRLVDWITDVVNKNIRPPPNYDIHTLNSVFLIHGPGIAVNGYSLSNALQNYFEEHIKKVYIYDTFIRERQVYSSEDIPLPPVNYRDVHQSLDIFDSEDFGLLKALRTVSRRQRKLYEFLEELEKDCEAVTPVMYKSTPSDEFGRIDLEPSREIFNKLLKNKPNDKLKYINELTKNNKSLNKQGGELISKTSSSKKLNKNLTENEIPDQEEWVKIIQDRQCKISTIYHQDIRDRIINLRRPRMNKNNHTDAKWHDLFSDVADNFKVDGVESLNQSTVYVEDELQDDIPEFLPVEISIEHSFGQCNYNILGMADEDIMNQVSPAIAKLFRKSKNSIIKDCWSTLEKSDKKKSQDKNVNKTNKKRNNENIEDVDIIQFEEAWDKANLDMDMSWLRLSALPGCPSMSQIAYTSSILLGKFLKESENRYIICCKSFKPHITLLDKENELNNELDTVDEGVITEEIVRYDITAQVLHQQYGYTVRIPLRIFLYNFSQIFIPRLYKQGIEQVKNNDNLGNAVRILMEGMDVPPTEYFIGKYSIFIRNKMILVLEKRREEYLKTMLPAAIKLQQAWRTLRPRLFLAQLHSFSVRIQALARRRFVKIWYKSVAILRNLLCGISLLIHLTIPWVKTSTIFDKLEELAYKREEEHQFFRNIAATAIQAWWRGEMVRRKILILRYNQFREFSILVIQSTWRTFKAQATLVEKLAFTKTPNYKATKIQAVFRGWRERKRFGKLFKLNRCLLALKRKSCIRIGIAKHIEYRGMLRRSHISREQIRSHREIVNKAIIIQRVFRMAFCRKQYLTLLHAARVVQCRAYTCLEVYRYFKVLKSASMIQHWWRALYKFKILLNSGDILMKRLKQFPVRIKLSHDPVKRNEEFQNLLDREFIQFDMMRYPLLKMQGLFQPLARIVESNTVFLNPVELKISHDIRESYPGTWGRCFVTLCRRLCAAIFDIAPTKQFPPLKIIQFSIGQNHSLALIAERVLAGQDNSESATFDTTSINKNNSKRLNNDNYPDNEYFKQSHALIGQQSGKLLNFEYKNHVYAWGLNNAGQLGSCEIDRSSTNIKEPIQFIDSEYRYTKCSDTGKSIRYLLRQVDYTRKIRWVGCGTDYSAAITYDGKLFTWGDNTFGQCGHGHDIDYVSSPEILKALKEEQIYMASCGSRHCAVVTQNGAVYIWGAGSHVCLEDNRFEKLYKNMKDYDLVKVSSNFYEPYRIDLGNLEDRNQKYGTKNEDKGSCYSTNGCPRASSNSFMYGGIRHLICGNGFNIICGQDLYIWGRNDKGQLGNSNRKHVLKPKILKLPTLESLNLKFTGNIKKKTRRRSLITLSLGNRTIISSISAGSDFVAATIENGVNIMYMWGHFSVFDHVNSSNNLLSSSNFVFQNQILTSKSSLKSMSESCIIDRAIHCPTIVRHPLWENKILTQVACTIRSVAVITEDSELYGFDAVELFKTESGKLVNITKFVESSVSEIDENLVKWKIPNMSKKDAKPEKKKVNIPDSCKDLPILYIPENYSKNTHSKHDNNEVQVNTLFYFEPILYQYRCVRNTQKVGLLTEKICSSVSSTMSILWVQHRRQALSQPIQKSVENTDFNSSKMDTNRKLITQYSKNIESNRSIEIKPTELKSINSNNNTEIDLQARLRSSTYDISGKSLVPNNNFKLDASISSNSNQSNDSKLSISIPSYNLLYRVQPKDYIPSYLYKDTHKTRGIDNIDGGTLNGLLNKLESNLYISRELSDIS
ncbi:IQ calmodulin-binding motif family protein [Cryptosporidium andersoni]|uniref:IQ calmodulin-binding motif family protein n=1 Tax=Cryptosporidium andersoni TaxID=117008 RepID=A0A1J4MQG9_9CRYT|nr:IQ calmodulin-binding motif family protein [Cryptosporidium andersoni]